MSSGHFVDQVQIHVKAGDGGHGCISFLRMKGQPFGGPDGGDGGRGGSVILEAEPEMLTLIDFKSRHHVKAPRGANGGGKNCSGRSGSDVVLKVPLGTVAIDADTHEELGDLTQPGQQLVIAKGGDGGNGNQHYATPTNKAPRKAQDGFPGVERNVVLELKVIADAGLVGLPNAGKSTLLAAMTHAHPKIAPYPFTTIHPNLGVFVASDFQRRITLADIPGLIEGAHTGQGLGHRFLRHIERTRALVHLVAPEAGTDDDGTITLADAHPETLLYAYDLVRSELESYSSKLLLKPVIVCLNKVDLMSEEEVAAIVDAFRTERDIEVHLLSAQDKSGVVELQRKIEELVLDPPTEESEVRSRSLPQFELREEES
ncbi:GTPase ObgE [bacterium]|nr:GTPase ObgE [bacterium]